MTTQQSGFDSGGYKVWSVMQEEVYKTKMSDMEELHQRIQTVCATNLISVLTTEQSRSGIFVYDLV